MSWNIAKPGDQINGPVAVTGNLNVDSNTLFVDSANNRVGVLTASPTVPLDVVGDAKVSGNLTVDTNTLVVDAANNRLGIGTATPSKILDLQGATASGQYVSTTGTNVTFHAFTNTGGGVLVGKEGSAGSALFLGTAAYSAVFGTDSAYPVSFASNNTERLRIASDGVCTWSNVGGNSGTAMTLNGTGLGVGAAPSEKLTIWGTSATYGDARWNAGFNDPSSAALGTGAGIYLAGYTNGTSGAAIFGSIKGIKENGTAGNTAGALSFTTLPNGGTPTERLRIDSSGNVGIGTATPSTYGKLVIQVNGTSQAGLGFVDTNISGRSWLIGPGTGTGLANDFGFYDNTGTQIAFLYTAGASGKWVWYTNGTERLRITSAGVSQFTGTISCSGNISSGYGTFASPGFVIGDTQYGLYVDSGNLIYKSGATGLNVWKNTANTVNTMTVDNNGNLVAQGVVTAGSIVRIGTAYTGNNGWINGYFGANILWDGANWQNYGFGGNNGWAAMVTTGTQGDFHWISAAGNGTSNRTYTEAQFLAQKKMTLDASGNLLVGASSQNVWTTILTVSKDSGTTKWAIGPWNTDPDKFIISASASAGVYLNSTNATSWSAISDERYKDIIEPILDAVAKVNSLRSVIGKLKSDETNTRKPFLIAQDVQAVLPEAVDNSNPNRLGLSYTEVIPLIVAAIKELTARVQTLENA